MTKDFELLGIGSDATEAEIKAAYRRRARELHPDLRLIAGGGSAGDEFLLLTEARRRALARVTATRIAAGTLPTQRRSAMGRTGTREDDPMLALLTLPQRCSRPWPTDALEVWALTVVPAARTHLADARQAASHAGAVTGRHRHWATVHALITLTLTTDGLRRRCGVLGEHLPSAYAVVERELPASLSGRLPERIVCVAPRHRTTLAAGAVGVLVGGWAVWVDLPGRLLG